jgi:NAD(P)-dependent dehydrogenase (short-subunit alcohol dehydrogenase family)
MKSLEGKVSLVTGGSRGIGKAICVALAESGSSVAVNFAQNAQRADEVCAHLRTLGVRAEPYQANIAADER